MENTESKSFTLTEEQLTRLLEAGRPANIARAPSAEYGPSDEKLCESLAVSVIQNLHQNWFYGPSANKPNTPKYDALKAAIKELILPYI